MTYYADLTPYTYDRDNGSRDATRLWRGVPLVNVGWLQRGKPYQEGAAPSGLAAVLDGMSSTHRAQQTRGYHPCPFRAWRLFGSRAQHPQGSAEIRVMGGAVAYAAPELIGHYVEAHGYLPPTAFINAVLATE